MHKSERSRPKYKSRFPRQYYLRKRKHDDRQFNKGNEHDGKHQP